MREVRAQANFDHNNLVRYHHSWVEKPPLDWDDPLKPYIFFIRLVLISHSLYFFYYFIVYCRELESDESSLGLQPGSYLTRYEPSISKTYFYIQMQLCKSGNLRDWLNNSRTLEFRSEKV